jgi:hypothetical protein
MPCVPSQEAWTHSTNWIGCTISSPPTVTRYGVVFTCGIEGRPWFEDYLGNLNPAYPSRKEMAALHDFELGGKPRTSARLAQNTSR